MRATAARALLLVTLLAACGASPPRTSTPTDEDAADALSALRVVHGESVELVAVRVVAATTFAVYAHDDAEQALIRDRGDHPRDCENFRMRYDAGADCWRMPPPT